MLSLWGHFSSEEWRLGHGVLLWWIYSGKYGQVEEHSEPISFFL